MSPKEIEQQIQKLIRITPQQVALAKAFLCKNFDQDPVSAIERLLQATDVKMPDEIPVNRSGDVESLIKEAAKAISWKLAGCEAIWGLISSNLLMPGSSQLRGPDLNVNFTAGFPRPAGSPPQQSSLNHLTMPLPTIVRLPYSRATQENGSLSDPDLFLHELDVPNLHEEVEEALREAVRCFHHELYLACLAMLGRSSEGAWIELGLKLARVVEPKSTKEAEKIRKTQEDVFVGIGKKIRQTLDVYERGDLDSLRKASGVTAQDLRNSVIWADAVRDSRNSIHYGTKPALPNSYEKVAALLIGAVPHLRILYRIHNSVDSVVDQKDGKD